jgi:hypothetical protein
VTYKRPLPYTWSWEQIREWGEKNFLWDVAREAAWDERKDSWPEGHGVGSSDMNHMTVDKLREWASYGIPPEFLPPTGKPLFPAHEWPPDELGDFLKSEGYLDAIRDQNGELPSTHDGGYPMIYLAKDLESICPECANGPDFGDDPDAVDDDFLLIGHQPHMEGPPETCVHCHKEIESAYGEPEPEDPLQVWLGQESMNTNEMAHHSDDKSAKQEIGLFYKYVTQNGWRSEGRDNNGYWTVFNYSKSDARTSAMYNSQSHEVQFDVTTIDDHQHLFDTAEEAVSYLQRIDDAGGEAVWRMPAWMRGTIHDDEMWQRGRDQLRTEYDDLDAQKRFHYLGASGDTIYWEYTDAAGKEKFEYAYDKGSKYWTITRMSDMGATDKVTSGAYDQLLKQLPKYGLPSFLPNPNQSESVWETFNVLKHLDVDTLRLNEASPEARYAQLFKQLMTHKVPTLNDIEFLINGVEKGDMNATNAARVLLGMGPEGSAEDGDEGAGGGMGGPPMDMGMPPPPGEADLDADPMGDMDGMDMGAPDDVMAGAPDLLAASQSDNLALAFLNESSVIMHDIQKITGCPRDAVDEVLDRMYVISGAEGTDLSGVSRSTFETIARDAARQIFGDHRGSRRPS